MYDFHIVKSGNFNEVIPYYNYHTNILYYKGGHPFKGISVRTVQRGNHTSFQRRVTSETCATNKFFVI